VRLQHGLSQALYRDLLQAATVVPIVSGFRNASRKLRLADCVSATIGAARAAIGMHNGWDDQSVEKHQGCCGDQ
jgi:hypothetical protein